MSSATLSIGTNMGDRMGYLRAAVASLGLAVRGVSAVFETAAWGPIEQDDFLNIVVLVRDDDADAREWLRRAHACEQEAHRTREVRWGPRTLDVDVVSVCQGGEPVRADDPILTLPHPRAHERGFVLIPWLSVAPDAQLAGHGAVAQLVAALPEQERNGVRLRGDLRLR